MIEMALAFFTNCNYFHDTLRIQISVYIHTFDSFIHQVTQNVIGILR